MATIKILVYHLFRHNWRDFSFIFIAISLLTFIIFFTYTDNKLPFLYFSQLKLTFNLICLILTIYTVWLTTKNIFIFLAAPQSALIITKPLEFHQLFIANFFVTFSIIGFLLITSSSLAYFLVQNKVKQNIAYFTYKSNTEINTTTVLRFNQQKSWLFNNLPNKQRYLQFIIFSEKKKLKGQWSFYDKKKKINLLWKGEANKKQKLLLPNSISSSTLKITYTNLENQSQFFRKLNSPQILSGEISNLQNFYRLILMTMNYFSFIICISLCLIISFPNQLTILAIFSYLLWSYIYEHYLFFYPDSIYLNFANFLQMNIFLKNQIIQISDLFKVFFIKVVLINTPFIYFSFYRFKKNSY